MSEEYCFPAGEMIIKDKKVHANADRGVLRIFISKETQLLSMKWENTDKKTSNEEIIITPGDWIYKKVSTSKGSPFFIQNTSYPDDKYFYYYQTKDQKKIEKIEKDLENLFKTGELPKNEEKEDSKPVPMSVDEVVKNTQNTQNQQNHQNAGGVFNSDFLKNFSDMLKKISEKKPSLNDVLKREVITKFFESLDENTKKRLIDLLPENQRSVQGFYDNINSPQFRQGLDSLTYALESENLPAIINSFQLNMNEAQKYGDGVEAFIKCIIDKYSNKEDKKEEKKEETKEEKK